MSNGKATYDNSINSWIDKKDIINRMSHFPEPLMELHLSIYVTKFVSKIKTGADT